MCYRSHLTQIYGLLKLPLLTEILIAFLHSYQLSTLGTGSFNIFEGSLIKVFVIVHSNLVYPHLKNRNIPIPRYPAVRALPKENQKEPWKKLYFFPWAHPGNCWNCAIFYILFAKPLLSLKFCLCAPNLLVWLWVTSIFQKSSVKHSVQST